MASTISRLAAAFNKAPVPMASRFRSMTQTGQVDYSKTAQLNAMANLGTVFSIVDLTSTAVASTNWHLYRKAPRAENGIGAELRNHAALALWERPNPFQTQSEFVQATQQHRDLTGEAWWVVVRDAVTDTIPLELWLIRPDRISVVPHPTDFISGYIYKGPDGEDIPLATEDVIRIITPNPTDPYRGLGPIQSMLTDIDSANYAAEWSRNFFLNSAEPGGIIEVEQRMSDDEFDELRDRWNEQHRGVAAAHRVAILEQGKWVDRKYTMRDMEFSELRNVPREMIREAFHVPKSMLGTAEDVNRANAEAGETQFARWTTTPRLEALKQALNEDPTPEDAESRNAERNSQTTAFSTLVTAGVDPVSAAETVGLPPMEMKPVQAPGALQQPEEEPDAAA
jgi:HK97 family phage portal protein